MGVQEKTVLPVAEQPASTPKRSWRKPALLALLTLLAAPLLHPAVSHHVSGCVYKHGRFSNATKTKMCAQADPLLPKSFDASSIVDGEKDQIVTWLSDAVKIPTEIFDVMGPIGEDKRWDVFYDFADYLEKAFPLVHQHLKRTRVMTHALVYEWEGSDKSLKPLFMTGHQDVVPVLPDTRHLWTHDPYGGEFDGERIWGRGSMDDKTGTIGALAAIELLLKSGKFQPTRTVVLGLGCDEETGGKVGAYNIGLWLEEKYGKDSMAILVDEGGGMSEVFGEMFALPAVAEKGYLDVELRVETLGGHSSVPPVHTGIGLASLAIAELERHPHPPQLNIESPLVGFVQCAARWAPETPKKLRKDIERVTQSLDKGKLDKKALKDVESWWVEKGLGTPGMGRALVSTTQAIDIINGGVKVNALPEVVTAIINHRISVASSAEELQERISHVLAPVAKEYNLAFEAFGKDILSPEAHAGKLVVAEAWNSTLNPAPISPHTTENVAWRVLSGTVRGVWATRPGAKEGDAIHMAPLMSTGNTDTKRYWNLTKNIYRFAYLTFKGKLNNAHTVDEWVEADTFVEQVRWFANFIVNMDESREEF